MLADWWKANRLEVYVAIVMLAITALVFAGWGVAQWWKRRR